MIRSTAFLGGLWSVVLLTACTDAPPPQGESMQVAAAEADNVSGAPSNLDQAPAGGVGAAPTQLSRSDVIQARRKFEVKVLSFDASQRFGAEIPYADYARLRITNNSDIVLPCLTILTKRYAGGEMVGSSRAPSITTRDIAPGESIEYDYYPKGHLDVVNVDKITAEVESIVDPEEEQFICELQDVS